MEVVALVILVLFTVTGLGVIGYALLERHWLQGFAGRAVTVPARVEGLKTTSASRPGRPSAVVLRYRAKVVFALPDGRPFRATTRWPSYHHPAVGSTIPVRYDPARPKRVVAADGPGSETPSMTAYFALGAVAIVFGWVVSSVLRAVA